MEYAFLFTDEMFRHALNGLSRGMIIFLIASGLTLIFGLVGLINFAHGAMFSVGGYLTIAIATRTGSYWTGLIAGTLLVATLGLALERTMLHRLYNKDPLLGFLATFGIALVIEELITLVWGSQSYSIAPPFTGSITLLSVTYPQHRLLVIIVALLITVLIGIVLTFTRLGIEIHATAIDESTAEVLGVNSKNVYTLTFVIGSALAALAGGLIGPITTMYPAIGMNYMLIAFLVVMVGGMGSFKGSFIASLLVGQIIAFGSLFIRPSYVSMGIFALAMVLILFKPNGLLGKSEVLE